MNRLFLLFAMAAMAVNASAVTVDITSLGAVNDTTVLSTNAIQAAIDSCHRAGGGVVNVPEGNFKTGSLFLRSNVTLWLENGATLYGSTDIADYVPVSTDYVSLRTITPTIQLIYADGASNVGIAGYGTIDGRGRAFPKLSWNDEGITRPHLLRLVRCNDVRIEGVTLKNSGCWMQHYLACDRVKISGITVFNRNNYNNDALDLDGCHDVTVSDMIADSDDDAITLKSTSPRLCEDIVISNCVVSSHCNAIKLGTETNGGFRNIIIRGIAVKPSADQSTQFFGHESGRGHGAIVLEIVDGGTMSNIDIGDITIRGTESPIFIRLADRARPYSPDVPVTGVGTIERVLIHDVLIDEAGPTGSSFTGIAGHPVKDVTLRNVSIRHQGGVGKVLPPTDEKIKEYPESTMWGLLPAKGLWLNHTTGVVIENLTVETIEPDERDVIVASDSVNIRR